VSAGAYLADALAAERDALSALLAGEPASAQLIRARDAYLASHAQTGSRSWGRLIGALKMAVLAGDGEQRVAEEALAETEGVTGSPAAAYARALAEVVADREPDVAELLAEGGAYARTGRALRALAAGDGAEYAAALGEIIDDFASRDRHLAGVEVADTALVLERLAGRRGMAVRPDSPMVPVY
jgi:hypothetical protein